MCRSVCVFLCIQPRLLFCVFHLFNKLWPAQTEEAEKGKILRQQNGSVCVYVHIEFRTTYHICLTSPRSSNRRPTHNTYNNHKLSAVHKKVWFVYSADTMVIAQVMSPVRHLKTPHWPRRPRVLYVISGHNCLWKKSLPPHCVWDGLWAVADDDFFAITHKYIHTYNYKNMFVSLFSQIKNTQHVSQFDRSAPFGRWDDINCLPIFVCYTNIRI